MWNRAAALSKFDLLNTIFMTILYILNSNISFIYTKVI